MVIFASASLFFALVAIRNHFFPHLKSAQELNVTTWNDKLESIARKHDKLIFVNVSADKTIPKDLIHALKDNYIFTILDKDKNPADYFVFDNFLKRASGTKHHLSCAILTPTLTPIYLSGKSDKHKLEKTLPIIAQKYAQNRHLLRNKADILCGNFKASSIEHLAGISLLGALANSPKSRYAQRSRPIAITTENARLYFRIFKNRKSPFSANNASLALNILKHRYANETNKRAKKLIARALSDIAFAVDKELISELKLEADTIISEKNAPALLLDNALNLAVLSRAYTVFKDEKYLSKADSISKSILLSAFNTRKIPATLLKNQDGILIAEQNSIACALGISIAANALCDYSQASNDTSPMRAALAIIKKLDSDYISNGMWTINSSNSPSSKFARPTILNDDENPSHVGEAYQAITRIKREFALGIISPVEISIATIENFFTSPFHENRASIKLAQFM